MVFRKPFAFIIKHFRLIHLILLGCMVALLINLNNTHSLFRTLHNTSTYTYAAAGNYIFSYVYVFIFIGLFISSVLCFLFMKKKKQYLLYLLMMLFFILVMIDIMYLNSTMTKLIEETLTGDKIRLCSDLSLLFTFPCYVFIIFCILRGIGFNIKQFNFSKDIAELNIVDKDSEEFEVLIGKNNYKIMRTIRRFIREMKYYFIENKFAIKVFLLLFILVCAGVGVYYYNNNVKMLNNSVSIGVNGIYYNVISTYATTTDYNGNTIKNDSKFIIINIDFYNSFSSKTELDISNITLTSDNLVFYPTYIYNEKFYDLGLPLDTNQSINSKETLNRYIVFEVGKHVSTSGMKMRIQTGYREKKNTLVSDYRIFGLNVIDADSKQRTKDLDINDSITSDVLSNNKFNFVLKGYSVQDIFNEKYVSCTENACNTLSSIVKPTDSTKNTLLILDYEIEVNDNAIFTNKFTNDNEIINAFGKVEYTYNNKVYTSNASVINKNIDGKVILEVPRRVSKAKKIRFSINTRNNIFSYKLK